MIWLLSIVLALGTVAEAKSKKSNKKSSTAIKMNLTKVGSCSTPDAKKTVFIIKQWHLSPTTITKGFPKERYPQERNQTAIYQSLSTQIREKKIQLLVSDGCEGEIDKEFKPSFNGWDYSDLHKVAQTKGYEKILSLIPLKLEARYEDKILVQCGDSNELIKEGNVRVSNLRGWMNFWSRLKETYPDDKGKLYGDAAAELLKVPKDTPTPELLKKISARMKEELVALRKSLSDRNDSFVKALSTGDYQTAAIVVGGLHADDLKEKVQAAGLGCDVFEPPGYQRESEQLIQEFEKAAH